MSNNGRFRLYNIALRMLFHPQDAERAIARLKHPADPDAVEMGGGGPKADDPAGVCGDLLIFQQKQQFATDRI